MLGPAKDNSLGLPAGRITVANSAGAINIDRPGYVTEIAGDNNGVPPTAPIQASPAQMQAVELSLFEQASAEIAKELNVDVEALNLQQGIDSDNDGELDTFMVNEVLAATLASLTESGQSTQDRGVLTATVLSLFGERLLEMNNEEIQDFFEGVNLGSGVRDIFAEGAEYLGTTNFEDLRTAGLTGSASYIGNNVVLNGDCGGAESCGTYNVTSTWNFTAETVATNLSGTFSVDNFAGGLIEGSINMAGDVLSWADVTGGATIKYEDFHEDAATAFLPTRYTYRVGSTNGANDNGIASVERDYGFSAITSQTGLSGETLMVISSTSLSNVQFGDTPSTPGNFAQHNLTLQILRDTGNGVEFGPSANGLIFGMERQ